MKRLLAVVLFMMTAMMFGQINKTVNLDTFADLSAPQKKTTHRPMGAQINAGTVSPSVSLACSAGTTQITTLVFNFYRSTGTANSTACSNATSTSIPTGCSLIASNQSACSYEDTTVANSTTYYYWATEVNNGSTCPTGQNCESPTDPQGTGVIATIPANPVPPAPTGLTVGTIVAGLPVQFQWNLIQPATGYTFKDTSIWRGGQPSLPSPKKVGSVTNIATTSFSDQSPLNKTHYYAIRTDWTDENGKAYSTPFSNVVKVVYP